MQSEWGSEPGHEAPVRKRGNRDTKHKLVRERTGTRNSRLNAEWKLSPKWGVEVLSLAGCENSLLKDKWNLPPIIILLLVTEAFERGNFVGVGLLFTLSCSSLCLTSVLPSV